MPNWKKIILSGSDAAVNSLEVTNAVSASEFTGSFTGSALLISASIGHLETIYETASVIYSSGSTKFGDTSDDTHEFTGSVDVSGSVTAHSFNISSTATGTPTISSDSNINLSASNAVVITSSPLRLASFTNAETGSITAQIGDIIYNSDTADYKLYSGSWFTILNETSTASLATTSSFAITASHTRGTASMADNAVTSSHTAGTASLANTATTSSYTLTGDGVFSGSFSGSFVGDASELNVNPFPFTGSGEMQGTLTVHSDNSYIDDYAESYFAGIAINSDGDMTVTGSIFSTYINANSFTGSLSGSATSASLAETASYFNGTVTSASFAETASFYGGSVTSASLAETASFYGGNVTSASLAETASFYGGTVTSASLAETASFYGGSVTSASLAETASFVETAQTASHALITSQSVNNNTASGSLSFWQGSQAEYNAISNSADPNTLYFVT